MGYAICKYFGRASINKILHCGTKMSGGLQKMRKCVIFFFDTDFSTIFLFLGNLQKEVADLFCLQKP